MSAQQFVGIAAVSLLSGGIGFLTAPNAPLTSIIMIQLGAGGLGWLVGCIAEKT